MDKILVTKSSLPPISEYIKEIQTIWDTSMLTNMGSKHQQLESELLKYLNVSNLSLFVNGHMALELTLQAFNLNGEVITTPFTFASTTHAIVRNGLTPVFCDINLDDYTIDVNKIESLITERTTAIVPVHVYGNVCDIESINEIAQKNNLKVIYDAAHAFGVEVKGQGIGSFGDASIFSFHATKVFNTIEGGAVTYNDQSLTKNLYHLKNFGIDNPENVLAVGTNAKMNEFQAAMGLCNLRHINGDIEKRKRIVQRYRNHLSGIQGIRINKDLPDVRSNYAYFPVLIDQKYFGKTRDEIDYELRNEEIYARKYFYPLTSNYLCYKGMFNECPTPTADYVTNRILTLPLYSDLSLENVDRICSTILKECI